MINTIVLFLNIVGLPSSLVEAEERRRKSSESSMSGGNELYYLILSIARIPRSFPAIESKSVVSLLSIDSISGNAPERGATTPSAMGSPRSGDITSSGGGMLPPPSSPVSRGDQLHKRIESLVQQVSSFSITSMISRNFLENLELLKLAFLNYLNSCYRIVF